MTTIRHFGRFAATLLVCAVHSGRAIAACDDGQDIEVSASSALYSYDPLEGSPTAVVSTVTVTNHSMVYCDFQVAWQSAGSDWNLVNGSTLTVDSLTTSINGGSEMGANLFDSPITREQTGVPGYGGTVTFTLTALLVPGQFVEATNYTNSFTAQVSSRPEATTSYDTVVATLSEGHVASVAPTVDFNIAGSDTGFGDADASKSYSIDFGQLTPYVQARVYIQFRGNTAASTTFSSQNGAVLKHSDPIVATTVPYTFVVDGSQLDLSNSTQTMVFNASTGTNGVVSFPVDIQLGTWSSLDSGSYSDAITLTVVAQ